MHEGVESTQERVRCAALNPSHAVANIAHRNFELARRTLYARHVAGPSDRADGKGRAITCQCVASRDPQADIGNSLCTRALHLRVR